MRSQLTMTITKVDTLYAVNISIYKWQKWVLTFTITVVHGIEAVIDQGKQGKDHAIKHNFTEHREGMVSLRATGLSGSDTSDITLYHRWW